MILLLTMEDLVMTNRSPFDLQKAIADAWDFCWQSNLGQRAENERDAQERGRPGYRDDCTYFLTASDIEAQVRQFAVEQAEGRPRGSTGRARGRTPMYTSRGRLKMIGPSVNGAVRDWLLAECRAGRLQSHNFGRGHVSGMRFRPAGEELTVQEQGTMARHEKRRERVAAGLPGRPYHYNKNGFGRTPLCTAARKRVVWRRSTARTTANRDKVTCPRCKNLLAQQQEEPQCAPA